MMVIGSPLVLVVHHGVCYYARRFQVNILKRRYGGPIGAFATGNREPGQTRKGAAAAVDMCAGVSLVGPPPVLAPRFSVIAFLYTS